MLSVLLFAGARPQQADGEGIEAAAAVPEALQNADGSGTVKLWGEDALIDWPGAMDPGDSLKPKPRPWPS